jgi:hypothetical protein
MVVHGTACVRRLAQGERSQEMRFGRFLANRRVTVDRLIEGWSERTRGAVAGRHVLAIQDTSEIRFATTEDDRRGLGKVKKGKSHGVLLHAMLAVDADDGTALGLVAGQVWTRRGSVGTPHGQRRLADKESLRWPATVDAARPVLAAASMVTVVNDREGEFFAHWCRTPGDQVHLLTRLMNDHAVAGGGTVRSTIAAKPAVGSADIELPGRPGRRPRTARLEIRFGSMLLKRPCNTPERDLPADVAVSVVEVRELQPPPGADPVHWILLTSHRVETLDQAWLMVGWYRRRWTIEQFFRTLKRQGLRIEDSQIATADRLCKMVAIAAKAAAIVMQLVHARDGKGHQPAHVVFSHDEIEFIARLNHKMQGKTERQKNPHARLSLAWAAWIIAKLGGWHVYETKPPGPITFHNGLTYFRTLFQGWSFKDV